jgi:ribosome recycling factor
MYQKLLDDLKNNFNRTIEHFKSELSALQAGRATPAMLEDLEVRCYGQVFPLKQLANIQMPEPRSILVKPWDKSILKDIESAIRNSNLDLSPVVDSDSIRLQVPSLTEEKRKELVKVLSDKTEEARISIRRQREEVWQRIQEMEKEKEISEDDKFKAKEKLQETVDEFNKKVEEIKDKKEKELMGN